MALPLLRTLAAAVGARDVHAAVVRSRVLDASGPWLGLHGLNPSHACQAGSSTAALFHTSAGSGSSSSQGWDSPWSDRIHLRGARFWGSHGALPEENKLGQPFEVDATVYCDLKAAGVSDDLAKTINYADVYRVIEKVVSGPPKQLLECVAETICRQVLQQHEAVSAIQLHIRKLSIPAVPAVVQSIGIELMRTRKDYPN